MTTWALLSFAAHVAAGAALTLLVPRSPEARPDEGDLVFQVRTRPVLHEETLPAELVETLRESLEARRARIPPPSGETVQRSVSSLEDLLAAEPPPESLAARGPDRAVVRPRLASSTSLTRRLRARVESSAPNDERQASDAVAAAEGRAGFSAGALEHAPPVEVAHVPARPDTELNAPVRFPPNALRRGLQGTTLLAVEIDRDGQVTSVAVARSSGHELLDRAAIEVVRTWTFTPATDDGRPVASRLELPIRFRIDEP